MAHQSDLPPSAPFTYENPACAFTGREPAGPLITQACSANPAITLRAGGRREEAGRPYSRVLGDMRPTPGDEHPNVVAASSWGRVDQDLELAFM
ncbi:hypothetical protein [Streptosporangium roseum]|uniref:hypothetical protein n=1 Tax=Streptosporangium roseum TaxID=2001 RepID=UPI000325A628|nr:hypothetical protein [Streptosporangium roseum]